YLQYDVTWASIALLYYDWALTFPDEVEYIWKAGIAFPTVLYVFCRYALLANVMYLLEISNLLGSRVSRYMHGTATRAQYTLQFVNRHCQGCRRAHFSSLSITCDNWAKFVAALSVFGRAAIIVTLIGRTYAVCSQSRWILAYLLALGIVCVVADAVRSAAEVTLFSPCPATGLRSFFMIAFETSVVILTTIRTIQALRVGGPWRSQKHRLIYLIFEEGKGLISDITRRQMFNNLFPGILYFWYTGFLQRLLDGLTLPLSGAFTARFILHLRAWRRKHAGVYFISTVQDPNVGSEHLAPEFSPPSSGNRTVIDLESSLSRSVPALDDFGEDPVAREIRQSESGIAVQVDFWIEHHEAI
ncbi:hypothetical protein EV360DRAFT_40232, partial [Lentinula raphanica]